MKGVARHVFHALVVVCFAVVSSCYAPAYEDCVLACDGDGRCPDGMTCSNAVCVRPGSSCSADDDTVAPEAPCEAGLLRCGRPGTVEICDAVSGQFRFDAECAAACHAGACVECVPGSARCDGDATVVTCGDDARWSRPTPCEVPRSRCVAGRCEPPVQLSAGDAHACFATTSKAYCWGDDAYRQLGDDRNESARGVVELALELPFRALAAGGAHTCALLLDDTVVCWGDGTAGQLGASPLAASFVSAAPVRVDIGAGVPVDVTSGERHSCVLFADGRVKCWGANQFGQLGLGDVEARDRDQEMGDALPAVDLGPGAVAVRISAGARHTCAVLADGSGRCWGANDFGQLGVGDTEQRGDEPREMGSALPPALVPDGVKLAEVDAGGSHTCALSADGRATCWGNGGFGQLGTGDTMPRGNNTYLPGEFIDFGKNREVLSVTAGANHSCALLRTENWRSELKCWGGNASGQLGIETDMHMGAGNDQMGEHLPPIDFGTFEAAALEPWLAATGDAFGCAAFPGSRVKCWGNNDVGQLGFPSDSQAVGDAAEEMGDALPFTVSGD